MPSSMSVERRKMLNFLGAKIVLTPKELGMDGAIEEAKKISKKTKKKVSFWINLKMKLIQVFILKPTAQEIWNDTQGKIDFFFLVLGLAEQLALVNIKEKNKSIKVIAVEPEDCCYKWGRARLSFNPRYWCRFIPKNLDLNVIDQVLPISNTSAFQYSKILAKYEGILESGISTGVCVWQRAMKSMKTRICIKKIVLL